MKKITLFFSILFLCSCHINQQAKEIKTLASCRYRIYSLDELYVAGTNVKKLMEQKKFNLTVLPSLAMGFLTQEIPLKADITFEISNPTNAIAAIQQFDYELLINQHEFTKGTYDQPIIVPAGDTAHIPIRLDANIYAFLANDSLRNQIQQFLQSTQQGIEKKATLTIKIKPGISVGNQLIKYPTFISINKELSNQDLL